MDIDSICQAFITIFGGVAIWLLGRKETWARWGYILGFLSQPFWFYTTIKNHQWGIFLLALWYMYCWGQGIYNYWIKKPQITK